MYISPDGSNRAVIRTDLSGESAGDLLRSRSEVPPSSVGSDGERMVRIEAPLDHPLHIRPRSPLAAAVASAPKKHKPLACFRVEVATGNLLPQDVKFRPYWSNRHTPHGFNLNDTIEFPGVAPTYSCRHFTTQLLTNLRENPGSKLNPHLYFSDVESVKINVNRDVEKIEGILKKNACGKYIIPNIRFGSLLCELTSSLRPRQQRQYYLESCGHSMAFQLEFKPAENEKQRRYVVRLYDPNMTNLKIRCQVNDPRDFDRDEYALHNFLTASNYETYFGNIEQECIIYDCSESSFARSEFIAIETASGEAASAPLLFHLLADGNDPAAIRRIADTLKARPASSYVEQLPEWLSARGKHGTSGLYLTLLFNHAEVLRAYGELLDLLPKEQRNAVLVNILSGGPEESPPGLYWALRHGNTGVIGVYGELLRRLDEEQHALQIAALLAIWDAEKCRSYLPLGLRLSNDETREYYRNIVDRFIVTEAQKAHFSQLLADPGYAAIRADT